MIKTSLCKIIRLHKGGFIIVKKYTHIQIIEPKPIDKKKSILKFQDAFKLEMRQIENWSNHNNREPTCLCHSTIAYKPKAD